MFRKFEDVVINLKQVQSIEPVGSTIHFTFINGKTVIVRTNQYDYIINGPGRTTNAMLEEYDKCIKKWQKLTIEGIYTSLKLKD